MIQKSYQQIKPDLDLTIVFNLSICRKTKTVQIVDISSLIKDFTFKTNTSYIYHLEGTKLYMKVDGRYFIFEEIKSYAGLDGEIEGDGTIKSKMPGKILETCIDVEQIVKKGDALLIMESMKMENTILSPIDGIVSAVHVASNDLVEADQVLVEISFLE